MNRAFTPFSSSASSHTYCNICYSAYDLDNNKPLLICHQNHSICKQCLKSIKRNLKCPFCRQNIRPNYIRLNKAALELIKAKQKNRPGSKKTYLKIVQNQRLPTANDEEELVDVSDLVEIQRPVVIVNVQRQSRIVLNILIFVQLFFLQLPFGLYSFYCGLYFVEEGCFPDKQGGSQVYLRDSLLTEGYLECMIGMLAIYFASFYNLRLLLYHHLACFYVLLIVIVEIKSCVFTIVYLKLIHEQSFVNCSSSFKVFAICNICANGIQLVLGLYLIRRLIRSAFLQ